MGTTDQEKARPDKGNRGLSTMKLAFGAASLFLFVVGLKRSFRTEEGKEILRSGEPID